MWKRASVRSSANIIRMRHTVHWVTPLLLWISFVAIPECAAQYNIDAHLLLPHLLSCDKKPLKGPVRAITEKQENWIYGKELVTVFYMECDEQARIKLLDNKLYGVRTYYHYRPEGRLQSTGNYWNGTPLDSIVYAYNDDGKVRATLHYGPGRSTLDEVREIRYDSTGMPVMVSARNVKRTAIEQVIGIGENYIDISWRLDLLPPQLFRYPYDPGQGCIISYDRRIENANGKKVMEIAEGPGRKNRIFIEEYEYDEMGNWIVCRYYNVKKGKKLRPRNRYLMRVREIEYR